MHSQTACGESGVAARRIACGAARIPARRGWLRFRRRARRRPSRAATPGAKAASAQRFAAARDRRPPRRRGFRRRPVRGSARRSGARPVSAISGSAPRSKRSEASVRRPSAFDVRRMEMGSNHADSSRTLRVAELISLSAPPITPPMATACAASAITHISGESARSMPSSVRIFSPARARRTTMRRSARRSRSKACMRLAQFEHDVIGGVHDVVDGGLPERFEAPPQPVGRGLHFHAAQDARRVAAAQFGAFDLHARGALRRARPLSTQLRRRCGAQTAALERRHFARHAVVAQAIGAIDGELGVEQRPGRRLRPGLRRRCRRARGARAAPPGGSVTSTNSLSQS